MESDIIRDEIPLLYQYCSKYLYVAGNEFHLLSEWRSTSLTAFTAIEVNIMASPK